MVYHGYKYRGDVIVSLSRGVRSNPVFRSAYIIMAQPTASHLQVEERPHNESLHLTIILQIVGFSKESPPVISDWGSNVVEFPRAWKMG